MKPPKYTMYLNGSVYGVGPFDYMVELMTDYVKSCDMYGKTSVDITIERRKSSTKPTLTERS